MKRYTLDEAIKNLDKVINNSSVNAVTEINPVMSDAYITSMEKDENVREILKPVDEIIKQKPFTGADDQPMPDPIQDPKILLDESLFEDFKG